MSHADTMLEVELHLAAWRNERLTALIRKDFEKLHDCEIRIQALAFLRDRIAA